MERWKYPWADLDYEGINDEKIRFSLEEEKVVNEKFNIALKPGRNKLYIVASDKKDIKTYKEIYFTRNEN